MKYLTFLLLFCSIAAVSYADDISISCDVDKNEIALDDQVTLTITVAGNVSSIPNPSIPNLKGFTAYSSGRSQNISIINGRVSSAVSFTYILVPNDTGEYTLGPFTLSYKGQTYSAGPINIKVLPRSASPQQQTPSYPSPQAQPQEALPEEHTPGPQKELFIETYVDKLRAYVNEQITLTFAFYQAVDLFENPVYTPPSTTGFWTEDMPPQKKYYKVINGRKYLVTEIKTALFATSPGEFTIGPGRLEASVEDMERFFSRNPFDFDRDPFSMFRRGKPVILTTEPIKLEILLLPEENKPPDFKGDVGRFDMSVSLDKNAVGENQPVTLKIQIKGEGNIKTISSPHIPEIPDAKVYDSASSENISKTNYIVQGEKVFEKVIIPKKEGALTIGPLSYTYFDPAIKEYIEKKIEPITIAVTKSKEESVEKPSVLEGVTKEEVELLKTDIAYIKTYPSAFSKKDSFLYKNKLFLFCNILLLFVLVFLYVYSLHTRRLETDIAYARSLHAKGSASRRLKNARVLMQKGLVKEFYAEIYRAVIEYIGDKLNIPHASITKDALEQKLAAIGADASSINNVKNLFDMCDMARFASAHFTKEDMQKTLRDASDSIGGLERFL